MRSMAISRRTLLAGFGGSAFAAALGPRPGRASDALFVSCAADREGNYYVAGFDGDGRHHFAQPLPARGHAATVRPGSSDWIVFARRPGAFAMVLDGRTAAVTALIENAPGRRFQGHGAFSADGRTLFASENDFEAGRGVLGLYDAEAGYRRVGEVASHGIGPHDLRLLPDGRRLAVANGGIRTHPDSGRDKLNIDSMDPSLAVLDATSGALLAQVRLPQRLHKLSIRHLDVSRDGLVALAMQYEGDRRHEVPLVGVWSGREIDLLQAPSKATRRMRHYTGSIAFDDSGKFLAASCPKGHLVTLWDVRRRAFLTVVEARDSSGLAATGRDGEFLISGGDGKLRVVDARTGESRLLSGSDGAVRWDNHLNAQPAAPGSSPLARPVAEKVF